MKKNYQTNSTAAAIAVPDTIAVAMTHLADELREGLLALAVGTGLQVMDAILEESVSALCGPRGRHDPVRSAVRHGHEGGSVALGGRKVPVRRPRVRAIDGSGEVAIPAYEHFSSTRGARPDGDGEDARQALDPSLQARSRARRDCSRGPLVGQVPLRGLAALSSSGPRPRSPSCWRRTSPPSTSSRSWSTASTSPITSVLSHSDRCDRGQAPAGGHRGRHREHHGRERPPRRLRDRGLDTTGRSSS